jgi:hypothetical protein
MSDPVFTLDGNSKISCDSANALECEFRQYYNDGDQDIAALLIGVSGRPLCFHPKAAGKGLKEPSEGSHRYCMTAERTE